LNGTRIAALDRLAFFARCTNLEWASRRRVGIHVLLPRDFHEHSVLPH
jgi:hypothetical protein